MGSLDDITQDVEDAVAPPRVHDDVNMAFNPADIGSSPVWPANSSNDPDDGATGGVAGDALQATGEAPPVTLAIDDVRMAFNPSEFLGGGSGGNVPIADTDHSAGAFPTPPVLLVSENTSSWIGHQLPDGAFPDQGVDPWPVHPHGFDDPVDVATSVGETDGSSTDVVGDAATDARSNSDTGGIAEAVAASSPTGHEHPITNETIPDDVRVAFNPSDFFGGSGGNMPNPDGTGGSNSSDASLPDPAEGKFGGAAAASDSNGDSNNAAGAFGSSQVSDHAITLTSLDAHSADPSEVSDLHNLWILGDQPVGDVTNEIGDAGPNNAGANHAIIDGANHDIVDGGHEVLPSSANHDVMNGAHEVLATGAASFWDQALAATQGAAVQSDGADVEHDLLGMLNGQNAASQLDPNGSGMTLGDLSAPDGQDHSAVAELAIVHDAASVAADHTGPAIALDNLLSFTGGSMVHQLHL
jgi:hypothetical protein